MERTLATPIGQMCLVEQDGALVEFAWRSGGSDVSPLLLEAQRQLEEYFAGQRQAFDLPLAPAGTEFQRAVWQALRDIPYGGTRTYGQIAAAIGRPKACRAVGMANHCNPLPVFLPCHRVVGADGSLTGYAGGLDVKAFLLALEGGAE